jgi:hypothetical protein
VPDDDSYAIDELDDEASRLRPVVRLAHLLFRECVRGGFAEFRLVTASGAAEVVRDGAWAPMMRFPPMVYSALVGQFETIVGVEHGADIGLPATRHLRLGGREMRVTMTRHGAEVGGELFQFRFEPGAAPAT